MPLASYLRKYFWDIDPKKAKPKSHPEYYIKRILELGDTTAFNWLKIVFGKKKIEEVLEKAKISSKSKNYWRFFFK